MNGLPLESFLRITLADLAVTRDIRESSELAELVLASLGGIMRVENRGVKSGPFNVLATAAMPAILVESAFITNPEEERKQRRDEYRQRIAEALCEGIGKFMTRYERRVGIRNGASVAPGHGWPGGPFPGGMSRISLLLASLAVIGTRPVSRHPALSRE